MRINGERRFVVTSVLPAGSGPLKVRTHPAENMQIIALFSKKMPDYLHICNICSNFVPDLANGRLCALNRKHL